MSTGQTEPPPRPQAAGSAEPSAGPPSELRRGEDLFVGTFLQCAAGLVQAPGDVLGHVQQRPQRMLRLVAIVAATMALTGLVVAAFSGGLQWLLVPAKLIGGMLLAALLCLPSLYIFSNLRGASVRLHEAASALLMGVALIGILLVGLAPVTWLFSQTTSSPWLMGTLHIVALLVACGFGLGLLGRAMAAMSPGPPLRMPGWAVMFVVVLLQLTTTLRPIVGPYAGLSMQPKQFFAAHWIEWLGAATEVEVR